MIYSYNQTGKCSAFDDCDGDTVFCKVDDGTCGSCVSDTECDGIFICKTDNTCGRYIYML